ncbi:MAG: two-component system response regulator, partial [Gammaproteobacteria bacterium]
MEGQNILIVEDEVITAMELQDNLQKFGYNVPAIASTGEDAIALANQIKPNLILMDIVLKGKIDGIVAAERIRQEHDAAVVFLTAYNDDHTFNRAKLSAPYGYLTKPFKTNELRTTLELALIKHQKDLASNEEKSRYDALTGLASRKFLTEQIKQILAEDHTSSQEMAILFLDIDQFKFVNNRLGYAIGDQILQIVAKRLKNEIKSNDIVSRIGGDEFAIVLRDINQSDVRKIADRILKNLAKPIIIDKHELVLSNCIGISLFPSNGKDEVTLFKNADIAMHYAKHTGRNNIQFCTSQMVSTVQHEVCMKNYLHDALHLNKFFIFYQPQIDIKSGTIIGIEALLRLQGANGNMILPEKFISIADETGLIVPIGEWLLFTACAQFKSWNEILRKNVTYQNRPIKLAVNLSARQLIEDNLVESIKRILKKANFSPAQLELEITESPIIADVESSAEVLSQLKEMGISIALDDFGIGYSSLNYFRQFKIDTLKVDQSLIKNIPENKIDSEMIISIIKLAHSLEINVIAEGVETEEQMQFLIIHGCDKA